LFSSLHALTYICYRGSLYDCLLSTVLSIPSYLYKSFENIQQTAVIKFEK